MRPIKFRGITERGGVVYGDLFQWGEELYSIISANKGVMDSDKKPVEYVSNAEKERLSNEDDYCPYKAIYPVKKWAQLIGVDKNGCEVYEGDRVTCGTKEYAATFDDFKEIKNGGVYKCGR